MSKILTEIAAVAFLIYAFSMGGIPVLVWRHVSPRWGVFFGLMAALYWGVSLVWPHQSVRAAQQGQPLADGDSIRFILSVALIAGGLGLLVLKWRKE